MAPFRPTRPEPLEAGGAFIIQDNNPMNKILTRATSSPDAALQFIVDTQYDTILARAIGGKVVNSDVGRENLFNSVKSVAESGQTELFNYLLGGDLSMEGLSPEAQEALQWARNKAATPAGQLQLKRNETAANGGNGGWTSENTSSALAAFGSLMGGILGMFGGDAPEAPVSGNNGQPETPAPGTEGGFEKYMPWVLGGIAVLIVAVVVVLALRKK